VGDVGGREGVSIFFSKEDQVASKRGGGTSLKKQGTRKRKKTKQLECVSV